VQENGWSFHYDGVKKVRTFYYLLWRQDYKKKDTFLFLATLHHLIGAECSCICMCVFTIFCVNVVVVHVLLWGFLSFSNILSVFLIIFMCLK